MADWLILEPYYGGSHRALVDGLRSRLGIDAQLWTLPARKWKWRMRGAAAIFAERWRREEPRVQGLFASSLLNAAELRGLLPAGARDTPLVLYFHENQLNYPVQTEEERDFHYGWINILSALAADRLLWNSRYNLDSFLGAVNAFVARMPDQRPTGLVERIASRSRVLPVPIDPGPEPLRRNGTRCRLLWNHRWEHDKDPEKFFSALFELDEEGLDFELSVLGESFKEVPAVFRTARKRLDARIRAWGYRESIEDYREELDRADLVVSTALHEFQGLSVLEAASRGARPLLPAELVYPEIWPPDFLYPRGEFKEALRKRILAWPEQSPIDARAISLAYSWEAFGESWSAVFQA